MPVGIKVVCGEIGIVFETIIDTTWPLINEIENSRIFLVPRLNSISALPRACRAFTKVSDKQCPLRWMDEIILERKRKFSSRRNSFPERISLRETTNYLLAWEKEHSVIFKRYCARPGIAIVCKIQILLNRHIDQWQKVWISFVRAFPSIYQRKMVISCAQFGRLLVAVHQPSTSGLDVINQCFLAWPTISRSRHSLEFTWNYLGFQVHHVLIFMISISEITQRPPL